MTVEKAKDGASGGLAERISLCIVQADAAGLHVVAAHLDMALNELSLCDGVRPNDAEAAGRSLQ